MDCPTLNFNILHSLLLLASMHPDLTLICNEVSTIPSIDWSCSSAFEHKFTLTLCRWVLQTRNKCVCMCVCACVGIPILWALKWMAMESGSSEATHLVPPSVFTYLGKSSFREAVIVFVLVLSLLHDGTEHWLIVVTQDAATAHSCSKI